MHGVLEFLRYCGEVKNIKRTGWLNKGIKDCESVADHMYRVAIMSFVLGNSIDTNKCIKMALVHDLAESIIGDFTPDCGIDSTTKYNMEKAAFEKIVSTLDPPIAQEIMGLWLEYASDQTCEARFVKDMDKLEFLLQAREYNDSKNVQMDDFISHALSKIRNPDLKKLLHQ